MELSRDPLTFSWGSLLQKKSSWASCPNVGSTIGCFVSVVPYSLAVTKIRQLSTNFQVTLLAYEFRFRSCPPSKIMSVRLTLTPPLFPNVVNQVLSLLAEWFDPLPQLTKQVGCC